MGFVSGLVRPQAVSLTGDVGWSTFGSSYGGQSLTGLTITEDTAMMASAVWGCVRIISESLATVPLILYRKQPDDRRERADSHYLYTVLHDRPNAYQTAFEFKEMLTAHCLLTGNAYARLLPGRRGVADQLLPMHPNRITIESTGDGAVRYRYREPNGSTNVYTDDEIFHLRGLSNGGGLYSLGGYTTDGRLGMSVLTYAREAIGTALAQQQFGARYFGEDATPRGVLTHPTKLSSDAQKRLRADWVEKHAGLSNKWAPAVLEEGMKFEPISFSADDSQWIGAMQFSVADIARFFRVPLHMIQETEKATSWGSGIEQLSLAFVTYTLLPWARRWEQAISRDLITQPDIYAEYLFDSLLRGDMKSRYEAYATARNWGWMSANDVLRRENQDPIPNGDIYLQAANMVKAGTPPAPVLMPQPAPREEPVNEPTRNAPESSHYRQLLAEAAGRVVRKETAALSKAAKRCDDPESWAKAVVEFYAGHAEFIGLTLQIDAALADGYVTDSKALLLADGAVALSYADWETERVGALVALATED